MLTPISAAVSRSWKVARIALPSRVRWISRCVPTISSAATTNTKTRVQDTETGPSTSGAVGTA